MIKTMIAVSALATSLGIAHAQPVETNPARLHDARMAHAGNGWAGTVGAMETYVYGLATSPQDVVLQQSGHATVAQGARAINTSTPVGYAPGTVGAAPGQ